MKRMSVSVGLVALLASGTAYAVNDICDAFGLLTGPVVLSQAEAHVSPSASGDDLGRSIAVGDFNGDNVEDVAIGANNVDVNLANSGAVYVFFGPIANFDPAQPSADIGLSVTNASVKIYGERSADKSGWSLANAGDVDSDGADDLVIGSNPATVSTSGASGGAGLAHVVRGGNGFTGLINLATNGRVIRVLGQNLGDRFGLAVSSAGDVDNDGYADVLIGAPGHTTAGQPTGSGAAYLLLGSTLTFSGGATSTTKLIGINANEVNYFGETAGAAFGSALSTVGDPDLDGYADFVIGAPLDTNGGTKAGAAYLFRGSAVVSGLHPASQAPVRIYGTLTDHFGSAVTGGTDVNNDGRADFLVGAEWYGTNHRGAAYLFLGNSSWPVSSTILSSNSASSSIFMGVEQNGWLGSSIAVGDFNQDNVQDAVIGAAWGTGQVVQSGTAIIEYGPLTGRTENSSVASSRLAGSTFQSYYGSAVAVSDLNGDGFQDILVGAYRGTSPTANSGAVYAYLGGKDVVDVTTWYADVDQDNFGNAATSVAACDQPQINSVLYVHDSTDCNDNSLIINPTAPEACDDVIDKNCDGFFGPTDHDGDGVSACNDCDDSDPAVNPSALEVCGDGVDNNCDLLIDDSTSSDAVAYYPDVDADSYGDKNIRLDACTAPVLASAVVTRGGDCNDTLSGVAINPGAAEVCSDNIDNDCDGVVNGGNAVDAPIWWADADGDTYGSSEVYQYACVLPIGYTANRFDCNDSDADVKPNAIEICDFVDNDCNGKNYIGGSTVANTPYNTYLGANPYDALGTALAFVNGWDEVDGNPVADILMSAEMASDGAVQGGVVYLRRGGPERRAGYDMRTTLPDGSHDYDVKYYATRGYSKFGHVIVTGDFDGDGRDDVAIGAPGARVPSLNQGAVYVFFGPRANGAYKAEQADVIIKAERIGDMLGSSLTVANLDNDGYADLVIGAPGYSDVSGTVGGQYNRGRAYVLRGANLKTRSGEKVVSVIADSYFQGTTAYEFAGDTVAAADLDGDGLQDVMIGAPRYGTLDNGGIYLFYTLPTPASGLMVHSALIQGTGGQDKVGVALAGVGDTNHDGYEDFVTSNGFRSASLVLGRAAPIASSLLTSVAQLKMVGTVGQRVGVGLSPAGDLNADTYADFMVGAPGDSVNGTDSGAQFIVYGRPDWTVGGVLAAGSSWDINKVESFARLPVGGTFPTYSASNYSAIEGARVRGGAHVADNFGGAAAAGADVDGDGLGDVLIAAWGWDRDGLDINNGRVSLYTAGPFGADVGTTVTASQTVYYWDYDADTYADRGTVPPLPSNPPTFRACPMHAPMDLSVPRIRGIPTIPAPDYHLLEDCNDRNKNIHPGAADANNDNSDSDCDGYDSANVLPVLTVNITPHLPTSADSLTANVTVVNTDNDPITLFYQWYKKLPAAASWTPIAGATTTTLGTINFVKGDQVKVEVYADDTRAVTSPVSDVVGIGNSPPYLTACSIVPATGGVVTAFSVAATGLQDDDMVDAGQLTVTYQWQKFFNPLWVNIPGATAAARGSCAATNYDSLNPLALYNCVRGASIRATCTPHDPALQGTTLISDAVTIVNTLPVVESCYITPTTANTTPDLTAHGVGSDADDVDVVSINYTWLITTYDGRTVTLPVGNSFPGSLTEHLDAISLQCTPVDSVGGTGTTVTTSAIVIQNTVPTAPVVNLTPDFPLSNEDLTANILTAAYDLDGDAMTYKYYWQKNGAPYNNPSYPTNNNTLSKTATTRGDTWTVTVVANDGYGDGATAQDAVLIRNTPPTFSTAVITPTTPDTRDDLLINAAGWSDDDGDVPQYTVAWTKNGSSFVGTLSPQTTMPATNTARGDQFQAIVTAWDGYDTGNAITTAVKTIVNAIPDPGTLSILPNPPGEDDTLNCNVLTFATDADGDALTYTVEWYRTYLYNNGVSPNSTLTLIKSTTGTTSAPILPTVNSNTAWMLRANASFPTENITNFGDKFYCKVTPNDGLASGTPYQTTEQTIQDLSLPAAPVITSIPRYINEAAVRLTGSCVSVPSECKVLNFRCSDDGGYVSPNIVGTCGASQLFTQDIAVNRGVNTTCYAYCVDQQPNTSANSNSVLTQSCAAGVFDSYELLGAAYGDSNTAGTAGVSGVINEFANFTDGANANINVIGNIVTSMLNGADTDDWFRFNTVDNPAVDAANATNNFNFFIDMTAGTSDYVFKTFRGATGNPQECAATFPGGTTQYQWYQRDRGDAPNHALPTSRQQCADPTLSSAPPVGNNAQPTTIERLYNDCADNTASYWVDVKRTTGNISCQHYNLNLLINTPPPAL